MHFNCSGIFYCRNMFLGSLLGEKGGMEDGKLIDVNCEEYILGQNIRRYRQKKGMSQMQLSDLMDVDRAAISNYENGSKGEMGFKMLRRFSVALEVSVDVLLGAELDEGLSDENQEILRKLKEALLLQQSTGV